MAEKLPVIIMDGGMGTTLEKMCKIQIANTPLWSAEAISNEPESIIETHLAFMRAGSRIIQTATYQCSLCTFNRAGYDSEKARQLMHRAVDLARQARDRFIMESKDCNTRVQICLSLGPFGATLSPTQEYGGFYPPPYGPRGFEPGSSNINYFDNNEGEVEAVKALAAFHLERLVLFGEKPEIWSCIDMIGFETVPLAREGTAIRMAMSEFMRERQEKKAWWISFVFPDGMCPEMRSPAGDRVSVKELMKVCVGGEMEVPWGVGVNCSRVSDVAGIIRLMAEGVDGKVWLVVYPNGGGVFDEMQGRWVGGGGTEWADRVAEVVKQSSGWAGLVVGGCCCCGAEDIRRLCRLMSIIN